MAEHAAKGGREFLSPRKNNWLSTDLRENLSRCSGMANVVSSLSRPTAPDQTMWDGYYKNEKLHDREPAAIVEELEKRWPHFWHGFPVRTELTDAIKRAFVGEWCRVHIRGGLHAYGKPNLRKDDSDVVTIV